MLAEVSQFLQKKAESFHAEVSTFTVLLKVYTMENFIFAVDREKWFEKIKLNQ